MLIGGFILNKPELLSCTRLMVMQAWLVLTFPRSTAEPSGTRRLELFKRLFVVPKTKLSTNHLIAQGGYNQFRLLIVQR